MHSQQKNTYFTNTSPDKSHIEAITLHLSFWFYLPQLKKGLRNTGLAEMNLLGSVPCLRLPCKEALHQKSRAWIFGKCWAGWWLSLPNTSPVQGAASQQRYTLRPPKMEKAHLPGPASALAVPTRPNWCCPPCSLLGRGIPTRCCRRCLSFAAERMFKEGTGAPLKLLSLTRLL